MKNLLRVGISFDGKEQVRSELVGLLLHHSQLVSLAQIFLILRYRLTHPELIPSHCLLHRPVFLLVLVLQRAVPLLKLIDVADSLFYLLLVERRNVSFGRVFQLVSDRSQFVLDLCHLLIDDGGVH